MRNLFIHLGFLKTGSSAIQNFLSLNRKKLQMDGCIFPESMTHSPVHHELWPYYTKNMGLKNADFSSILNYYKDKFDASSCHTMILSSELLTLGATISDYLPLTESFNTHYIIYIRNPVQFAQSLLISNLKSYHIDRSYHGTRLLATAECESLVRYQLKTLKHFFNGKIPLSSNIIIRPYDLIYSKKSIIDDFCKILHLDNSNYKNNNPIVNPTLRIDCAYFLAHCSVLPLNKNDIFMIIRDLEQISSDKTYMPAYRLFSRKQLFDIPSELVEEYIQIGKQIGDEHFWDRGLEQYLKKEQCPWQQLPADLQDDIFERLSPESQKIINKVWPHKQNYPGQLLCSGFLPDIPSDEKTAHLMRRWIMALQ